MEMKEKGVIKVTPGCKNCLKAKQRITDHQTLNLKLTTQIRMLEDKFKKENIDEVNNHRKKIEKLMAELDIKQK